MLWTVNVKWKSFVALPIPRLIAVPLDPIKAVLIVLKKVLLNLN